MSIFSDLLGGLAKPVSDYLVKRQEVKAQKLQFESQERIKRHELEMAHLDRQTELASQGLTADANWEMEFARQAASTYKDEYTLIVVSIPAVLAFIPAMAPYVAAGFAALGACPGWYQIMLCSIFLATYGIRFWRRGQSDTP